MTRQRNKVEGTRAWRLAIACAITVHFVLLILEAWEDSPTLNEPEHMVAGLSNWQLGRFDVYAVNPPLIRMIGTAPALLARVTLDWASSPDPGVYGSGLLLGSRFFTANRAAGMHALFLGRCACSLLGLLGAWVCCRWANDLYGRGAALLALILWCACPNIIGHGHLVTPDVGAASLGVAANYAFWRWLDERTAEFAALAALGLGLAALAKFTLIILFPVWLALFLISLVVRSRGVKEGALSSVAFAAIIAASLVIINSFYGFRGTGTRMGDLSFLGTSASARNAGTPFDHMGIFSLAANVPLPFPRDYLAGVYMQAVQFESGQRSYLFGQWHESQGWWYYYLACLVLKTPVGVLVLLAGALAMTLVRHQRGKMFGELCVLAPGVCVFALVSSKTGVNHHLRYVLPALPFLYIWASKCARMCGVRALRPVIVGSVVWACTSSLWCAPHSLSYFNEFAGGPRQGYRYLSHSNVDWGQDLLHLKRWLVRHGVKDPIYLACTCSIDPESLGICARDAAVSLAPGRRAHPGWYAISACALQRGLAERSRELPLAAMAGYSIEIHRVSDELPSGPPEPGHIRSY